MVTGDSLKIRKISLDYKVTTNNITVLCTTGYYTSNWPAAIRSEMVAHPLAMVIAIPVSIFSWAPPLVLILYTVFEVHSEDCL